MGLGSKWCCQMIQPNYIVVIWSDDTFSPYHLIKSLTEPSEVTNESCDDYGHTFPVSHTVVKGHYLEFPERLNNVILVYENVSKVKFSLSTHTILILSLIFCTDCFIHNFMINNTGICFLLISVYKRMFIN